MDIPRPKLPKAGRLLLAGALAGSALFASQASAWSSDPGTARPGSDVVRTAWQARFGGQTTAQAPDTTLAMRDLAYALPTLHGEDRATALRLLARPTDPDDPFGGYYGVPSSDRCYSGFCVTWVTTGPDAPPLADANTDSVPDWVETTRDTVASVLAAYAQAGYRPPLPDSGPSKEGPDTQLDIYLANLGDDGLYGYCVPDLDNYDAVTPSYCVLDNDFSAAEFGAEPLMSLSVTAAHELFHATQFSYDATEAPWFMESTATWMEDERYDDSNDNYQYLPYGPMGKPTMSLDDPDPFGANVYGAWIFWRFVSEQLPSGGGAPAIRKTWELAGDGPGEPNLDGLQATRSYVEDQGVDWPFFFSAFAAANRVPAAFYEEGGFYPSAPAQSKYTLTPKKPSTGKRSAKVDHLASNTVELSPVPSMRGKWSLTINVDLPPTSTDVRAVATVFNRNGSVKLGLIKLNSKGDGGAKLNFRPGDVRKIGLTFVNAGTRYECGVGSDWSCEGRSLDDGRKVIWSAKATRAK